MPYSPSDDPDAPTEFRPRRRTHKARRRRRRPLSYPLQLLGAACAVAAVLFVAVIVIEKAAHPYWLGHQVGQEVATLKTRLRAQRQRNADLARHERYLASDEGAEVVARRAHYCRPGEQVILLTNDPAAAPSAEPAP